MKLPHQIGLLPSAGLDVTTKEYVTSLAQRDYLVATLGASQASNLSAGNHIEFNFSKSRGTSITLSSGTGQESGIFTLEGGKIYKVEASLVMYVNEGYVNYRWHDHTNDVELKDITGVPAYYHTGIDNYGTDTAINPVGMFLIAPTTDLDIKIEVFNTLNPVEVRFPTTAIIREWY